MRSRASFVRFQSASEVRASLATFGDKGADRLDARVTQPPPPAGEPGFTYRGLFHNFDVELATVQTGLVEAEDAHLRNKIRVSQLSTASETLTTALYGRQVATRRAIQAAFGSDHGFEVAAVSGSTPRELWALVDQVDQTVKILDKPVAELPPAIAEGGVDIGAFLEGLQTGLGQLRETGGDLERARKATGESLIVKNQAIKEFDAVFPPVARSLEGLFQLAGETELAERIRTSARRVTRHQAAEEPEEEPGSEGSSGEGGASEPSEPVEAGSSPVVS